MEFVKPEPQGYIVDPDWNPKLEIQTSSRRKRKRLPVIKGMYQEEKQPWGFRTLQKQGVVSGHPGKSKSCKKKRRVHGFSSQVEVTPAMDRAKIVQENLDARYPSFVRLMIHSNVAGGFWLSLPKPFCNMYMPKQDTIYLLVDGKGQEYKVKYLADRVGFSGGWRGFSIAHKLLEGDVLVFHFVGNYKIKVYIVRVKSLDKVDAALSLMHLSAHLKYVDSDCIKTDIRRQMQAGDEQLNSVPQVLTHRFQTDNQMALDDQFGMELVPQVLTRSFQKDNQVALNDQFGMALDQSEINDTRRGLLLEGLISETTSISDVVESCRLTASPDKFAYKLLLVNIGFTNARLNWLLHLAVTGRECSNYKETLIKQDCGKEGNNLETEMPKLDKAIDRLYAEIDALKAIHTQGLASSLRKLVSYAVPLLATQCIACS